MKPRGSSSGEQEILQKLGSHIIVSCLCIVFILLFADFLCLGRQPFAATPRGETKFGCATHSDPSEAKAIATPVYGYRIIKVYPHDPEAFTQGVFFDGEYLYESTGLYGRSSIRKVEITSGKVIETKLLPVYYFGEGLVKWKHTLIQLTWQSRLGLVYDASNLNILRTFNYTGEGWGITEDGECLIISDGSSTLRFLNPVTFEEVRRIEVCEQGIPVRYLNELEYIRGEIFANVWRTDLIARISPQTGEVLGWVDLAGLRSALQSDRDIDVLNGIAYDAQKDRIFVTGKFWPDLFEIQLVGPLADR